MDTKTVWFGTEDDLVQVKCPSTELTRTRVAWRNSGTYLNGGGFALSSGTAHEEASISWGADSVDGFATLMTQLNKGESLYYLDPLACETNILPPYAAQYQPNNPFGFVAESATGANGYPSTAMKNLYVDKQIATVPVPEGYRLWVGCKGSSGGVSVDAPPPEWVEVARNAFPNPACVAGGDTSWFGVRWNRTRRIWLDDGVRFQDVIDSPEKIGYGVDPIGNYDTEYDRLGDADKQRFPVTPGETIYAGFRARWSGDCEAHFPARFHDGEKFIGGVVEFQSTTACPAGEWVAFEGSLVVPEGAKYLLASHRTSSRGAWVAGDYTDLSNVYFGNMPLWFSGDHAPDGMRSEWLGEPNNSVSVLYEQEGNPSDPEIPATPPNSGKRVTHSYPGGRAYHLFVQGGSVLQGVMAQILPEGQTPASGGFIPGMGFSALALQDNPQITEYSAVLENYQMAMTANFIEVGSWM